MVVEIGGLCAGLGVGYSRRIVHPRGWIHESSGGEGGVARGHGGSNRSRAGDRSPWWWWPPWENGRAGGSVGILRPRLRVKTGRGCPCRIAGRSLRPSRPPVTRGKPRSAILAALGFPRRLHGTGNPDLRNSASGARPGGPGMNQPTEVGQGEVGRMPSLAVKTAGEHSREGAATGRVPAHGRPRPPRRR